MAFLTSLATKAEDWQAVAQMDRQLPSAEGDARGPWREPEGTT